MPKFIDLTGKRFGRLTAIQQVEKVITVKLWECKCECGVTTLRNSNTLRTGHTKSCGCLSREALTKRTNLKHGLSKLPNGKVNPLYHVWTQIKQRCRNPRDSGFKDYGGRGITFFAPWDDFKVFYDWAMSAGYVPGLTIERIDNDRNYEPENCTWISWNQQRKNNRRVIKITYGGRTQILTDWAKELGIKYSTINSRLQKGYSIEKAFQKEAITWNRKWNREARKKREIYPQRIKGRFQKDSPQL
jgi:hypothetical protein